MKEVRLPFLKQELLERSRLEQLGKPEIKFYIHVLGLDKQFDEMRKDRGDQRNCKTILIP